MRLIDLILFLLLSGDMAKQIVKDMKDAGGFITRKDLRKYKALSKKPLKSHVRGLDMLSIPAPGCGALVSLALKIMAGRFTSSLEC